MIGKKCNFIKEKDLKDYYVNQIPKILWEIETNAESIWRAKKKKKIEKRLFKRSKRKLLFGKKIKNRKNNIERKMKMTKNCISS